MSASWKKRSALRLTSTIAMVVFAALATAQESQLPRQAAVPGGIATLKLFRVDGAGVPTVRFRKKRVMVVQHDDYWTAIVGLPLGLKPGQYHVQVTGSADRSENHGFTVEAKEYEVQRLTIKNKRMVNPTAMDLERIGREKKEISAAFRTWTDIATPELRLHKPVVGPMSSPFGLRRYFNDQPRKPHSGIDIAAPEGTDITAPAAGTVVQVGDYFFNGNTVFVDHGQGLVSMFCHMQHFAVTAGQKVQRGDRLGAVGKTGRVTGAHLHWSLSLNDSRVDPGLFMTHDVGSL